MRILSYHSFSRSYKQNFHEMLPYFLFLTSNPVKQDSATCLTTDKQFTRSSLTLSYTCAFAKWHSAQFGKSHHQSRVYYTVSFYAWHQISVHYYHQQFFLQNILTYSFYSFNLGLGISSTSAVLFCSCCWFILCPFSHIVSHGGGFVSPTKRWSPCHILVT